MKKIATLLASVMILIGCKAAEIPQERMISGVVTSDYDERLPFATIHIKGTKRSVQTDINDWLNKKA